ncbi:serine/threonine protein kinase [Salpingoeca rosetta]|uniref:Serine/threonine protein kinase n=1 Tax=Salpingoeca rosetta (strain ATCC 50818 / BSB-021) TaxID=946362 RepID=F2USH1_SALR5|nr:serine/threonine protein kinase [Salpingoeca rosetta]EGD81080.1 serine/threonine protein kinase [Salpingoeca rosetta]|eukprot:XP_004987949.1 serine/threonine protein kinase [Salpingoeca rosetta]
MPVWSVPVWDFKIPNERNSSFESTEETYMADTAEDDVPVIYTTVPAGEVGVLARAYLQAAQKEYKKLFDDKKQDGDSQYHTFAEQIRTIATKNGIETLPLEYVRNQYETTRYVEDMMKLSFTEDIQTLLQEIHRVVDTEETQVTFDEAESFLRRLDDIARKGPAECKELGQFRQDLQSSVEPRHAATEKKKDVDVAHRTVYAQPFSAKLLCPDWHLHNEWFQVFERRDETPDFYFSVPSRERRFNDRIYGPLVEACAGAAVDVKSKASFEADPAVRVDYAVRLVSNYDCYPLVIELKTRNGKRAQDAAKAQVLEYAAKAIKSAGPEWRRLNGYLFPFAITVCANTVSVYACTLGEEMHGGEAFPSVLYTKLGDIHLNRLGHVIEWLLDEEHMAHYEMISAIAQGREDPSPSTPALAPETTATTDSASDPPACPTTSTTSTSDKEEEAQAESTPQQQAVDTQCSAKTAKAKTKVKVKANAKAEAKAEAKGKAKAKPAPQQGRGHQAKTRRPATRGASRVSQTRSGGPASAVVKKTDHSAPATTKEQRQRQQAKTRQAASRAASSTPARPGTGRSRTVKKTRPTTAATARRRRQQPKAGKATTTSTTPSKTPSKTPSTTPSTTPSRSATTTAPTRTPSTKADTKTDTAGSSKAEQRQHAVTKRARARSAKVATRYEMCVYKGGEDTAAVAMVNGKMLKVCSGQGVYRSRKVYRTVEAARKEVAAIRRINSYYSAETELEELGVREEEADRELQAWQLLYPDEKVEVLERSRRFLDLRLVLAFPHLAPTERGTGIKDKEALTTAAGYLLILSKNNLCHCDIRSHNILPNGCIVDFGLMCKPGKMLHSSYFTRLRERPRRVLHANPRGYIRAKVASDWESLLLSYVFSPGTVRSAMLRLLEGKAILLQWLADKRAELLDNDDDKETAELLHEIMQHIARVYF